ncbi:MAG: Sapep family Mn(2+)-dependent dipeptidase [Eubacteriales bacterium]|nr:Sapep family Mn(2+)-dependent dipeptidase [Eubacteriales bacterium]
MKNNTAKLNLGKYRKPMTETLREWIKIPSLKADPAPGAPFGPELARMLEAALASCRALGFKTRNVDGYVGEAWMGEGSDEDALAILAHVDVVPVGDGWTREPFGGTVEGSTMYGRGTSDDKGPLAAALYAMYAVKEAGVPLKRKVKLIIGCDEESGWEDIAYYKTVATLPRSGFSPDATYPVINIEKGGCHYNLTGSLSQEGLRILSFSVGERFNVIPGSATALVEGDESMIARAEAISRQYGWPVKASMEGNAVRLTATGINGHAAHPSIARNAIGQMLITLRDLGAQGAIRELADKIGTQYLGEGLGIKAEDAISGELTCNMGIIRVEDGQVSCTLDIRTPLLVDGSRLRKIIQDHLEGITVEELSLRTPHYVPLSSELVQGLLEAYHEVTGREKKAIAIGGGTYARSLKEGVAFGATFPEDPDVAHQADEYVNLDSLMRSTEIFASAIIRLAGKVG